MEQQESSQPSTPPRSATVGRVISAATVGARRIAKNPRVRGEIIWVLAQKTAEFVLQLATLKVLTNLLGAEIYGEFGLALSALLLIGNFLIMPVQNTYLRIYHQADTEGTSRHAGVFTIRWFTIVTLGILVLAAMFSRSLSGPLGFETWTILAAGCLFLCNRWRLLAYYVTNNRRHRRSATAQVVGNLVLQLGVVSIVILSFGPSATGTLFGFALATSVFALLFALPLVRRVLAQPVGGKSGMRPLIKTFGLPFGLLLTCQWVQGFTDRYILAAEIGKDVAGQYIAAFQVCGVPFMLMWFFLDALLMPIMYQRAKDPSNHAQVWSAYRIFLGGLGLYIGVGILAVAAYLLIGRPLLVLLTNESFELPVATIVLLALSRFVQCLTFLLDRAFTINQAMTTSLVLRVVSAVLTVPICLYFIRTYGLVGAPLGTLLVNGLHIILQLLVPNGCIHTIVNARRRLRDTCAPDAGERS